jgi:proton glutamate symport protein
VIALGLWGAGVSVRRFAMAVREPFLLALGTTSSAAALPKSIEAMEAFGVRREVAGLALPLGLSFNLCGSTIHLAMATLFVAQAAGVALSPGEQVMILATLKLTSKGVAGIPRANFVILSSLFTAFGLPLEGLAMLLGIDAAIDMIRTGVNVLGNCAATAILDRRGRA